LAEGSHTAVHKSATAMEPTIRKTTANTDETVELIAMEDVLSHRPVDEARAAHTEGTAAETRMARAGAVAVDTAVDEPPVVMHMDDEIERPDRLVSEELAVQAQIAHPTPLPIDQLMSDLPSLDLHAPLAVLEADADADADAESETPSTAPSAIDEPTAMTQEMQAQADTSVQELEVAAPAQFLTEMNFPALVVKLKIANDQIRSQIEKLEKPLFAPIVVAAPTPAKSKEAAKKPAKGH
jgi:hypothetical protein